MKKQKPDLRPALFGDEVITSSPRRSDVRHNQLGVAVQAAPRQNLFANPEWTAKFSAASPIGL